MAKKQGNELIVALVVLVVIVGGFALFQGSSLGEATRSLTYTLSTTQPTSTATNTVTTAPRTSSWKLYSCACSDAKSNPKNRCYETMTDAKNACTQICQAAGTTYVESAAVGACAEIPK